MQLAQPGAAAHIGDVGGIERAAAHDDQPLAGGLDGAAEIVEALHRRVALAAGEHAIDAAADERLDGFGDVAGHVEGAVAGDRHRPRRLDEPPHAVLVDAAVRRQAADDHAGDAEPAAGLDVGEHAFELEPGIEKISAARADDDVEGDRRDLQRLPDDAERGRQPALQEARAELDAIGAAILRRDKPVDALDADLDQQRHLDHRAGIRITGG